MEIKGKIISCLPVASGTSAKGTWKKQEYILQTEEQFPKKICFVVWGDKIDEYAIRNDEAVEVSIDIESREFNGKWYTDVKAWKVAKTGDRKEARETRETKDAGGWNSLPPEMPIPDEPDDSLEPLPF